MLYTQMGVLRDQLPAERKQGLTAGHTWIEVADAVVFYLDYGMSPGMEAGLDAARRLSKPFEYRFLHREGCGLWLTRSLC